jgi:hypothetical protein
MFTSLLKNVVAVSAVLFPVVSANAADHRDPLAAWVIQVNRQVDSHIVAPDRDASGKAVITFRRGTDGRPYDVAARSGEPNVAAAGVRTILRLRNLPPLPAGFPSGQKIVMNFLVGTQNRLPEYQEGRRQLLASADKANAEIAARMNRTQVALLDR